MKKQTAVEWLFDQIPLEWTIKRSAFDALQKAKAMEKEQIIDSFLDGQDNGWQFEGSNEAQADSYYNETFNTETP